jgi:transcriptional regulator with XRE-family HTH domain
MYIVVPKLNKILKERNMTQIELSQLTGIPQGTISKFDRNRQHMDLHLVTISRVLGITMEDLFEIDEQLEIDIKSLTD